MYHDQGLIPLKLLDFDSAVNVTLGLSVIRTSPDHGVAYDIAGRGLANPAARPRRSSLPRAGPASSQRAQPHRAPRETNPGW